MAAEHLRAFAAIPGVRLVGIMSRSRERAERLAREHGVQEVCDSLPELFDRTTADLVVVTVSVMSVQPVALKCCEFPWKILIEKPPGLYVAETETLWKSAAERQRDVRVALNRQCLSATQAVLTQLASAAGTRYIKVRDQQPYESVKLSSHPPEVLRRWMYANSIHTLDYFRLFARGELTKVTPIVPWQPVSPGLVVAGLEFDSGDYGLYEAVWHAPGPWAVTVTVPGRRWEMRPLEQAVTQAIGGKSENLAVHAWDQEFKPGFRLQAEKAVALARGNPCDLPTLDDALGTMCLIQHIYPNQPDGHVQ